MMMISYMIPIKVDLLKQIPKQKQELCPKRPLSANYGVESNIESYYWQTIDTHMPHIIGTNSNIEKKTSGWNVISLDKEFDSFSLTSSLESSRIGAKGVGTTLSIPQINCSLEFTMSMGDITSIPDDLDLNLIINSEELVQDDKYLNIQDESMVLYLLERNGFTNSDSFEVEVFLFEEDESDLIKLHFLKEQNKIVDDMLVDSPINEKEPDRHNVEYYIDLLLDREVPDEDICKGIDRLRETTIYSELDLKCPDRQGANIDIYTSTIGDVEECD